MTLNVVHTLHIALAQNFKVYPFAQLTPFKCKKSARSLTLFPVDSLLHASFDQLWVISRSHDVLQGRTWIKSILVFRWNLWILCLNLFSFLPYCFGIRTVIILFLLPELSSCLPCSFSYFLVNLFLSQLRFFFRLWGIIFFFLGLRRFQKRGLWFCLLYDF